MVPGSMFFIGWTGEREREEEEEVEADILSWWKGGCVILSVSAGEKDQGGASRKNIRGAPAMELECVPTCSVPGILIQDPMAMEELFQSASPVPECQVRTALGPLRVMVS